MAASGDLKRENAAQGKRISTLHAAILRFNASLDLDTVLGVVAVARPLASLAHFRPPVFNPQIRYPSEFTDVARNQCRACAASMGRHQQIVRPDHRTALCERLPCLSVVNARARIERLDVEIEVKVLQLPRVVVDPGRVGRSEAKLGVGD